MPSMHYNGIVQCFFNGMRISLNEYVFGVIVA